MKKLTFLCVAVMVTAALIFRAENSFSQVYQLENGDFEDWPGSADSEPTGWNSFPSASCELPSSINIFGVACNTAKTTRHERSNDVRPDATGKSCKIYATSAFSMIANGALTSGLMHLASTTPDDNSNCNQTKTDDNDFNHRLNAKPDSIVFWAKVVNASDASQACCHLYIHDNYDLKDPLPANPSGYESHIVGGVPSYNFTNTTGGVAYDDSGWRRHSTPIIYEGYTCNDPQFVLITFSTNATPGGGSANDALYIDDIEFIYNPIHHQFTESACGHYTWDGTEYTESGEYEKRYTVGPRDSIVTLHLTINNSVTNEITETADNSFTWNNWDLSMLMRGAFGYKIFNMRRYGMGLKGCGTDNVLASAYTDYADVNAGGSIISSYFLEKGDYFKLDNVTLGYTFMPKKRNLLESMRVYLSAKNLFTLTGYKGNDPSIVTSTGITPGIDTNSAYPQAFQFTLGVTVRFH